MDVQVVILQFGFGCWWTRQQNKANCWGFIFVLWEVRDTLLLTRFHLFNSHRFYIKMCVPENSFIVSKQAVMSLVIVSVSGTFRGHVGAFWTGRYTLWYESEDTMCQWTVDCAVYCLFCSKQTLIKWPSSCSEEDWNKSLNSLGNFLLTEKLKSDVASISHNLLFLISFFIRKDAGLRHQLCPINKLCLLYNRGSEFQTECVEFDCKCAEQRWNKSKTCGSQETVWFWKRS